MPTFLRKAVIFIAFLASVSINAIEAVKQSELRGRKLSREEATNTDATTSYDFFTPPMEEVPMDTGVVDRALNGRAKEMMIINDEHEPLFQVPSKEVMDEFMKNHQMKQGIDLPMIKISERNTIKVNGAVHSMDDLLPMDVFSPDATYMDDGKEKPLPAVAMFMKVASDNTMLVTKGPGGNVQTIDITYADGSNTFMEEVSGGVLAVMLPEARDKEAMSKFIMAETKLLGESGNNSSEPQIGRSSSGNAKEIGLGWRKLMEQSDSSREERHLQSGCSMLRVIEVAIAYDSSFCSKMNGASNANAAAQQIVARASTLYQNNFCGKIQITYLEGFCDPSTDPYAAGVRLNQSVCGNSGLLQFFSSFWGTNRGSVRRDTAHLFSGTALECNNAGCVIGCASVQSLCSTSSSYGVNHITFSTDGQIQSNLFAHELGHNSGSSHDNQTDGVEWIMEPFISSGANGFSTQSRSAIGNYLAGSSCISVEPSQPLIPNWSTCTRGSSTCANNWVCCVAPADVSSGKATCRPNQSASHCVSSSTVPN